MKPENIEIVLPNDKSLYNPEFVEMVLQGDKDREAGLGKKLNADELHKLFE